MPNSSTNSRARPSLPEGQLPLDAYVDWLWQHHGQDIGFLVLFGSRARGDALEDSDYDLLLGLSREDGLREIERFGLYQDTVTGKVQVFPYTPREIASMEEDAHLLLLEALADGVSLFDRGTWGELRQRSESRIQRGVWRRFPEGWIVEAEAESTRDQSKSATST